VPLIIQELAKSFLRCLSIANTSKIKVKEWKKQALVL